jgi:hypothetical protein
MTERRTFQETKRELADLDEGYLLELMSHGEAAVEGMADDLVGREMAADYLNLARLGLWVVRREQQSRRN